MHISGIYERVYKFLCLLLKVQINIYTFFYMNNNRRYMLVGSGINRTFRTYNKLPRLHLQNKRSEFEMYIVFIKRKCHKHMHIRGTSL